MLGTLSFIQQQFPNYVGEFVAECPVTQVMTDSRAQVDHALFIPIVGEHFDAHQFIEQAIENGAVAALWQNDVPVPEKWTALCTFFLVPDTLKAMQKFANAYRRKVNPTVVGITGSNGKTTTKDLVKSVVSGSYRTHATKGNFNNEIGMPLTILSMPQATEILILEMGMNQFHEIERLSQIAEPDYAIITNIGESHIEFLGSREGIAEAKQEIRIGLQQGGLTIFDGDESLLAALKGRADVLSCGFTSENDLTISDVELEQQETVFTMDGEVTYRIPLLGEHHAKNASFAIALAEKLGIGAEEIQKGLEQLDYTSMRFEWLQGKHHTTLINDAYNASYTSMKAAINVLEKLKGFKRKIVVLGDILELGDHAAVMHSELGKSISTPIDMVYTYGNYAKEISIAVRKEAPAIKATHFTDKADLKEALSQSLGKDTIILFKASRGMRFEELVEACQ